jgi:Flp pilus assembly protein TadB
MRPELKRELDRQIRRERLRRGMVVAAPLGLAGLALGSISILRVYHGGVWVAMPLALVAVIARPLVLFVRSRRRRKQQGDSKPD